MFTEGGYVWSRAIGSGATEHDGSGATEPTAEEVGGDASGGVDEELFWSRNWEFLRSDGGMACARGGIAPLPAEWLGEWVEPAAGAAASSGVVVASAAGSVGAGENSLVVPFAGQNTYSSEGAAGGVPGYECADASAIWHSAGSPVWTWNDNSPNVLLGARCTTNGCWCTKCQIVYWGDHTPCAQGLQCTRCRKQLSEFQRGLCARCYERNRPYYLRRALEKAVSSGRLADAEKCRSRLRQAIADERARELVEERAMVLAEARHRAAADKAQGKGRGRRAGRR